MEHIESTGHSGLATATNLSYPLREPVIRTQPKSQCTNCCLYRNSVNIQCEREQLQTCTCSSNQCSRQCYSSYSQPFLSINNIDDRSPWTESTCNAHRRCECHQRPRVDPTPNFNQNSIYCSCYQCQRSNSSSRVTEQDRISHIHLTTNNITYPSPYYATALPTFNGVHSSWEPTFHREYHSRMHSSMSPSEEVHRHTHHHIVPNHSPTTCFENRSPYANAVPTFFATSSRLFRRSAARLSSHPYPSLLHYPYPTLRRVCGVTFLPPQTTELFSEIELEPYDGEWIDNERRSIEPKVLTKEEINKLPKYIVTKETMKDFTDGERCVICMSNFDVSDDLRILPCAHEFHAPCVDKWLQTNATCPICRSTVEVT